MTPRWRTTVLLCGASLLIASTAVRSTRAERASTGNARAEIPTAQAAGYVGFGSCATSQCHTAVKDWALKLDGEGGGKKTHYNAINQLDAGKYPDVKKFLGAVNAKDAYQEKTCLDCHATPDASGDLAGEGVTCEKCHGAGSKYKVPHQEKKGAGVAPYVALGMIDYEKNPRKWVALCIDCHVLNSSAKEQALAGAGHPNGSEFDVVQAYKKVGNRNHWATRNYTDAEVAKYRPAAKPVAPPPAPVTPPPAAVTPAAAPSATTPAPITAPTPGPPTPSPKPAPAPVAAIVAPVPPAPAPPVTKSRVTPVAAAPVVTPVTAPVAPPVAAPVAPPVAAPPPATPGVPLPPVGTPSGEPRTMSGLIASVQGRLINVLTSLLRQNSTVPQRVVPPVKPAVYSGPDRDLLKLQDDIISLALEVLGKAPGKGGGSQ